jgi:hypothetical protein
MKKAKTDFYLKVRAYPNDKHGVADVWLIRRDGDAHCCFLHGRLHDGNAEALAADCEAKGIRVEREDSPHWVKEKPKVTEQKGLFQ